MQTAVPRKRSLRQRLRRCTARVKSRVPYGLRLPLGVLLMCGGVLGFLPILGFWMLPVGFAVAALDIKQFRRRSRRRRDHLS